MKKLFSVVVLFTALLTSSCNNETEVGDDDDVLNCMGTDVELHFTTGSTYDLGSGAVSFTDTTVKRFGKLCSDAIPMILTTGSSTGCYYKIGDSTYNVGLGTDTIYVKPQAEGRP